MSIDYGFDTSEIELESFSVGEGAYKVLVTNEIIKDTKDFDVTGNRFLECTYEIMEGNCKGLKIFDRFNIWNSNDKAANIAKQTLKKIEAATGKPINTNNPVKGRVLRVHVRNQKNSEYTEVWKYESADAPAPATNSDAPF